MRIVDRSLRTLLAVGALSLVACHGKHTAPGSSTQGAPAAGAGDAAAKQGTGSAQIAAVIGPKAAALGLTDPSAVTQATVTISGAALASPLVIPLTQSGTTWQAVVGGIPAGVPLDYSVQASDAQGKVLYQAHIANETIGVGTTPMEFVLQDATPAPAFANAAPLVQALVASEAEAAPGDQVAFTVTASDPNGQALSYAWSTDDGQSSTSGASFTWTAPQATGSYKVQVVVTNAKGATAGISATVHVSPANYRGAASFSITFNTFPVVQSVTASSTLLTGGQSTTVTAAATDADGDPLTYAWTSSCAGGFASAAAASSAFTLDPAVTTGDCDLKVTVSDGRGGVNTGTLTVHVGTPPAPTLPPVIDLTLQGAASVTGATALPFSVSAHDPAGKPLTFTWTSATGLLAAPVTSAGQSAVTWTPAACGLGQTLTATVADDKLSATKTFTVDAPSCALQLVAAGASEARAAVFISQDVPPAPSAGSYGWGEYRVMIAPHDMILESVTVSVAKVSASLTQPAKAGASRILIAATVGVGYPNQVAQSQPVQVLDFPEGTPGPVTYKLDQPLAMQAGTKYFLTIRGDDAGSGPSVDQPGSILIGGHHGGQNCGDPAFSPSCDNAGAYAAWWYWVWPDDFVMDAVLNLAH